MFSGLSFNQLTRDTWGSVDALAIAQLAGLSEDDCYRVKYYKAPDDKQDLIPGFGYVPCGLYITPGSIIWGYCLPCNPATAASVIGEGTVPPAFTVQITDHSVKIGDQPHKWFSDPVSSLFLANYKPTYQGLVPNLMCGSFPNLLKAPYPVVGSGVFTVEIQSTSSETQRIQLVLGVLEVCK